MSLTNNYTSRNLIFEHIYRACLQRWIKLLTEALWKRFYKGTKPSLSEIIQWIKIYLQLNV